MNDSFMNGFWSENCLAQDSEITIKIIVIMISCYQKKTTPPPPKNWLDVHETELPKKGRILQKMLEY